MKYNFLSLSVCVLLLLANTSVQAQWAQKGQDLDGEAGGDGSGRSVSISADVLLWQ